MVRQTFELARRRMVGPELLEGVGPVPARDIPAGRHHTGGSMTWQRLESTTVDPDLIEGQEARIADPYG